MPENLEEGEIGYTGNDFITLAKGNLKYAQSLLDRVTWQFPETLMQEDLNLQEIFEINGQIVISDGENTELSDHLEKIADNEK